MPITSWPRRAAKRVAGDFRLMRATWRTTWALRRLVREAAARRPAIAEACRALGEAACERGAGADLSAMGDVTKQAQALAQAEADLEEREQAVATALAALEAGKADHAGRIAPLEAAYRPLAEAEAAARAAQQAAERELNDLKARLDKITVEIGGARVGRPTTAPVEELQRQAAELTQAREAADARRSAAAEGLRPAEAKAAEARESLSAAQRVAADEESRLTADLRSAESARDAARGTVDTRRVWLGRAHADLGTALVAAKQAPEGLHEEFAAAQAACARAADAEAQMAELRREQAAAKAGAARFALYAVGALAAVVAVTIIVWRIAAPAPPPPPGDGDIGCV